MTHEQYATPETYILGRIEELERDAVAAKLYIATLEKQVATYESALARSGETLAAIKKILNPQINEVADTTDPDLAHKYISCEYVNETTSPDDYHKIVVAFGLGCPDLMKAGATDGK